MMLASVVALLVRQLLVFLDLVVSQPANEAGTGRRTQAGIAADGAQDGADTRAPHRAGQCPLLRTAQVAAAGQQPTAPSTRIMFFMVRCPSGSLAGVLSTQILDHAIGRR